MATILRRERWRKENEMGKDVKAIGWLENFRCTGETFENIFGSRNPESESKGANTTRLLPHWPTTVFLLGMSPSFFPSSLPLLLLPLFTSLFLLWNSMQVRSLHWQPLPLPELVHFTDWPCTHIDRASSDFASYIYLLAPYKSHSLLHHQFLSISECVDQRNKRRVQKFIQRSANRVTTNMYRNRLIPGFSTFWRARDL